MLLHDNIIFCLVKYKAVVEFHCTVKYTNNILYFKCIFVMAESDKTLIKDDNFSNNNRKTSTPSIVPPGTVLNDKGSIPNAAVSEPSTLKRKQTSFQITSVTVKGSRLSTDGGEDSADDLDESHTEDANSDILDCSRTTDVDNDQLSEDNTNNTTNNDDALIPAPSIPLESKVHLPIKKIAQNNALLFPSESSQINKLDIPLETSQHVKPPTLPDQWQHRFRVVKIVSSVPFKRGRWLCMDFMDPPAPVVEAKPESIDSTIGSSMLPESIPADRVAHVYEIPPGDAYPGTLSMVIRPDERLQPMYGIFLPISNGQYPLMTGMNSKAIGPPIHSETKTHDTTHSVPSTQSIQHQTNVSVTQTTAASQPIQHQKLVSSIQTGVSNQGAQHQQNVPVSNTQPIVSTQGFQQHQQQNISTSQPVMSTQGIQHQSSASVASTQGVQHTVTSTLSPVSNQAIHQTVSNVQTTATNLGSQHILPNTQTSQGIQQMSNTTQGIQSVASNIQCVPQGIQSNVPVTQPILSSQGMQQNIPGSQATNQGIQHSQSVNVQSAIPVQGMQHSQNMAGVQSSVSMQSSNQPQQKEQGISNLPLEQQKSPANQGLQSSAPSKLEKVSQPIPVMQPSTPPQSQTKIVSNIAMSQQAGTSEAVTHSMQSNVPQESQHIQILKSSTSQAAIVPPSSQVLEQMPQTCIMPPAQTEVSQTLVNQEPVQMQPSSVAPSQNVGASMAVNPAEISVASNSKLQDTVVPSQVIPNHVEVKELGTPPSSTAQEEVPSSKSDVNGEDSENVPSGTSTVAIDNKIEQAMDLVKSHLMFAVREEVDVLKEKITELMDRISQLEYENGFLRANATQQTLEQLNQTQLLQQQQQQQMQLQQQQSQAPPTMNSIPLQQIPQQQINIQDQQPTS